MWESRSRDQERWWNERLTASESFAHDGDRTSDKHVDERGHRTRTFHTIQLVKPFKQVQDRPQSGACCPFVETENETHGEEWCEPAWLGARRLVAERTELKALSRNLEKAESAEVRKTTDQDQGECRDGESSQENAKQAFQLEPDSKPRKPRKREANPRDDTG